MSMRISLNLGQQGLILAAVPLLFQLLFIALLYNALQSTEHELVQAAHARDVVGHSDLLAKLMKADNLFYMQHLMQDDRVGEAYTQLVGVIRSDVDSLEQLVGKNPKQLKQVGRIERTSEKMISYIEENRKDMDPNDKQRISQYVTRLKVLGTELSWQIEDLIRPYRKLQETDQKWFRERLKSYLAYAVVANILIAIGLALAFNRVTIRRVKVLMDNTQRFAQNQPLQPTLNGKDELAELDRFFHKMADSVESANRMKREFMAMITHDIRTPLASMQGLMNLISRGVYGDQLSSKSKDSLDAVDHEFQRLIKMINDLLEVEQLESGKLQLNFEEVPMAYILEQAYQAVRGMAAQKKIIVNIADSDAEVFADGDRMVRVLVNLLANAIRFSPENSKIDITETPNGDWLEIRVSDQGPGIEAEYHNQIFDRFKQAGKSTGAKKSGAGLGLAICKDIVEAHGGSIGVESAVGKGTVFWFKIPRSQGILQSALGQTTTTP
jgi:signal transduction histidine kinase